MTQKIVGNFVVGTVYSRNDAGKWSGAWVVRRYGINNGQVIADDIEKWGKVIKEAGIRAD